MMITPTRAEAQPRPSSAVIERITSHLGKALGPGRVINDRRVLETYADDQSNFGRFPPDLIIKAESAQEVSLVLQEAARERVPVVPRGGGTGRVGGALAISGGIILSLEKMNKIQTIDEENFLARLESGVNLGFFQQAVEEQNLFYPPDPSSFDACTIGGNVATNAGGPRAFKYGVTANYVLGVEVVLPTGEILQTGRNTFKGGAGYELHRLMVGSEGTLGVITGVTLKLVARPTRVETALVVFSDPLAASRAVLGIMKAGITPCSIEFMDRVSIEAARSRSARGMPKDAGACLIIELDGYDDRLLEELSRVAEICEQHQALQVLMAQDESQRRELWTARRDLSPVLRELYPCKVAEDIVVPRSKMPDLIEGVEKISRKHGLTIATFGHAGDGNFHVNVLFDEEHRPMADCACLDVLKLAADLGGTVAGEHGTGLQKVDYLKFEQSKELLDFQGRLKRFFDPAGILNPGKVVPVRFPS
ncbi:FAD-linked oxidase C-terminal domain-containing protein [Bdellovibrionota bacterium FG-2]